MNRKFNLTALSVFIATQLFAFETVKPQPKPYLDAKGKKSIPHVVIGGKPVFRTTTASELLNIWGERPKVERDLFDLAAKKFQDNISKDYNFSDIMKMSDVQTAFAKAGKELIGGPMLGNVTSSSISVWVRTLKPAKVKVVATSSKGKKIEGENISTNEKDLSAVVELKGLKSESKYTYEVFVDGKQIKMDDIKMEFRTPTKEHSKVEGRVIFGSCFHRWGLGNAAQTNAMIARDADALLFIGDIATQGRRGKITGYCKDHLLRDMYPTWRKLVAKYPVYTLWDDHDYLYNDASGVDKSLKVDAKRRAMVWDNWRDSWVNPSYGSGSEGLYFTTTVGAADFICVDNRYFNTKTKTKNSYLGEEQMQWLKKTLLESKSPFKILSCGTMWSDYVSNGKDSWGFYDPEGRDEILKFIVDNNIKGVLLISGDRHGARGFALPMNDKFSFYEFNGASLGGRWGPEATNSKWTTQLYGIALEYAFSEFTFGGSKSKPTVEFNLIGEKGNIIYNRTFTYDELTPKK